MLGRLFLSGTLLCLAACSQSPAPVTPADTVYLNADIYTVDADNSRASAMAVSNGKIVAIGSDDEIREYAGEATAVIDLDGRMVMPGIHDTHIHPSDAGIQKQLQCSFLSFDLDEVLEILKGCIDATPDGEWVRGGQWNDGLFASGT